MFNFCFLRIQELWSEFLLNQIRTPWILRFFCVFLSPFVSFLWLYQRLQIGYGKFFRQNTTPCGVEIFPKTHVAWTFHSNLRVYLCHGNVSNGRTEIPAKVHGSDCNQVACPPSGNAWENESFECQRVNTRTAYWKGTPLIMNREKQGQQAHETSVPRKGRTNACHLPGTSDVLLWGLPISRQLSMSLPLTVGEEKDMECWMPECFSVSSS